MHWATVAYRILPVFTATDAANLRYVVSKNELALGKYDCTKFCHAARIYRLRKRQNTNCILKMLHHSIGELRLGASFVDCVCTNL